MSDPGYAVHDIVQVVPEVPMFGGCLMVVSEVKDWGLQGFVRVPGMDAGDAYLRVKWDQIEPTGGRAVFAPPENEES